MADEGVGEQTAPKAAHTAPPVLVPIPGGVFELRVAHTVREGRCPLYDHGPRPVQVLPFALSRTPTTNDQFAAFLAASGYQPDDPRNFLRHWPAGRPPLGRGGHPVVWVSPRDADAYAAWAGLRLPTDEEWQWAAQGPERLAWPWGQTFIPAVCSAGPGITPVDAFPGGASPFGCLDMAGNTWEWTAPEWDDDWHRWRLLRGGSYFVPQGSFWYAEGGPCPNHTHLRFLLMSEGLNRCATIGFRCA
ncbi:MAG: formylglycine-generating enzyme family protein, partial [Chloroflexota bacterium]